MLLLCDSGSKDRKTIIKQSKIQSNNKKRHKKFNVVHYQCNSYVHRHRDQNTFTMNRKDLQRFTRWINFTHKEQCALLWSLKFCEELSPNPKMGVYMSYPIKGVITWLSKNNRPRKGNDSWKVFHCRRVSFQCWTKHQFGRT